MPSGGYRPKKTLSREQLRKMQEAYKHADKITETVRVKEKNEQEGLLDSIEKDLIML